VVSRLVSRGRPWLVEFVENDMPRLIAAQFIGVLLVRKLTLDDSNTAALVGAMFVVWLSARRPLLALALSVALELVLCAAGNGPDVAIGAVVVCASEIDRQRRLPKESVGPFALLAVPAFAAVSFLPYALHWRSAAIFMGPARATNAGLTFFLLSLAFLLRTDFIQSEIKRRSAEARVAEADAAREEALRDERSRIARELHDVVAHQMSVVVAQSQGAAAIVESNPTRARTALDLIARTTRDALVELRRLLGVVRSMEEGDATPVEPQPKLLDIEALAATGRAAGLDVSVEFSGRTDGVADAIALSAYRVVQESLTNAAKHAPGATAAVRVSGGEHELTVGVVNGPAKRKAPALAGSQSGLVGMRERVEVFGGTLAAGPTSDGGWSVVARFPTLVSPADE
jgi:signal transduction histidine kinase